jgi:hypothetical protein
MSNDEKDGDGVTVVFFSRKRPGDRGEVRACGGCHDLWREDELKEIRPGLRLCQFCQVDVWIAKELGLTLDDLPGLPARDCGSCGRTYACEEDLGFEPVFPVCPHCGHKCSDDEEDRIE